jgi:hypothetical protein
MATLTIDGTDYAAVSNIDWSTETLRRTPLTGGGFRAEHVTCFIEASISIVTARSTDADKSNAHVQLSLDDGRVFEGYGLYNTASGTTDGSTIFVRYEGKLVTEV